MLGLVGEGPTAEAVREAAAGAGARVVAGSAGEVLAAEPKWLVAVGEPALLALVRDGASGPVLPVAAGPAFRSVPGEAVGSAVEALLAGDWTPDERRTLSVSAGGEEWSVLMDATLVTTEPVRISEYAVSTDVETVDRFRADGVVVATPTGSRGYARSAGGPVVAPGTGAVVVVPIAPFSTDRDRWVLDPPVALAVERDSTAVSLLVDDADRGEVPTGASVTVRAGDRFTLATVPESRPFFDASG